MKRKLSYSESTQQELSGQKRRSPCMSTLVAMSDSITDTTEPVDIVPIVNDEGFWLSPPSTNEKKHTSNETFKQIFLHSVRTAGIINDDQHHLIALLDYEEIIIFLRQLTHLKNKFKYFKLQEEQCSYYHYIGVTECVWNGSVPEQMGRDNCLSSCYGRKRLRIGQCRKRYKKI